MTNLEFERIYRRYFDRVYRYLLRLSKDQPLAEEITSETFFKALRAIDRFKGDCRIESWLCQIAKNTYYSYLKKERRTDDLDTLDELASKEPTADEQLLSMELSASVQGAIQSLKEPYKRVFLLRAAEAYSFRRIAALYGKTENWACVTYHRAKKKLQELLEEPS